MTRFAHVDGNVVPLGEATVSIEDRGFLFGDGVYDVARLLRGEPYRISLHVDRLIRNAEEMEFAQLPGRDEIASIVEEVVDKSDVVDGMVYMQLTRGSAPRQASFPDETEPTVVVYVDTVDRDLERRRREGASVILVPEMRWRRCDVKSVNLLPKVLMRQEARRNGAYEAVFTSEGGLVWEGTSTNVFVVENGVVRTSEHPRRILPGLTRREMLMMAANRDVPVQMGEVTVEELYEADEVFLTGTLTGVLGVSEIDGETVGGGEPGETTRQLHEWLVERRRRRVGDDEPAR